MLMEINFRSGVKRYITPSQNEIAFGFINIGLINSTNFSIRENSCEDDKLGHGEEMHES